MSTGLTSSEQTSSWTFYRHIRRERFLRYDISQHFTTEIGGFKQNCYGRFGTNTVVYTSAEVLFWNCLKWRHFRGRWGRAIRQNAIRWCPLVHCFQYVELFQYVSNTCQILAPLWILPILINKTFWFILFRRRFTKIGKLKLVLILWIVRRTIALPSWFFYTKKMCNGT